MAKKAAALQSFQKCDVSNLAIPTTIAEDSDVKHDNNDELTNFGLRFDDDNISEKEKFVFVESEAEKRRREASSDRIEIAVSPR